MFPKVREFGSFIQSLYLLWTELFSLPDVCIEAPFRDGASSD